MSTTLSPLAGKLAPPSLQLAGEKIESILDRALGESFRSDEHLREILREAQGIVDAALAGS